MDLSELLEMTKDFSKLIDPNTRGFRPVQTCPRGRRRRSPARETRTGSLPFFQAMSPDWHQTPAGRAIDDTRETVERFARRALASFSLQHRHIPARLVRQGE
jgi:hypothetical protein